MEEGLGLCSNQCSVAARVDIDQHASTIKPFSGTDLHQVRYAQIEHPTETGIPLRHAPRRRSLPSVSAPLRAVAKFLRACKLEGGLRKNQANPALESFRPLGEPGSASYGHMLRSGTALGPHVAKKKQSGGYANWLAA